MNNEFPIEELDYDLPEFLIAQHPAENREDARLLIVNRQTDSFHDGRVTDLPNFFNPGDLLILNNTKVLRAKFIGRRQTGGKVEGLYLSTLDNGQWLVMLRGSRKLREGEVIEAGRPNTKAIAFKLEKSLGEGQWEVNVDSKDSAERMLEQIGWTPLPPYIRRPCDDNHYQSDAQDSQDRTRYQTVYAARAGAVAAPTAGLHLTHELFDALRAKGVNTAFVTLHVGAATFKPINVNDLADHTLPGESLEFSQETADAVKACRKHGGRIAAVGTTSVRVLEWISRENIDADYPEPRTGYTELFVYPPYKFHMVDSLMTNFHLPRSTLLALVMAFGGVELIRRAYKHAITRKYRFYSYGDAMLIL